MTSYMTSSDSYLTPYTASFRSQLKSWLDIRMLDDKVLDQLPSLGYVGVFDGNPIACGFLRHCEGGYGLIDSFLTNPEADKDARNHVLNLLTIRLLSDAKNLGMSSVLAFTIDNNTLLRALNHGFTELNHKMVCVSL